MTKKNAAKQRKLAHEILGMIGLSALLALIVFLILSGFATAVAESYCFRYEIPMTEFDWMDVDRWIFGVSVVLSLCVFTTLFLLLLNDRIVYIRTITNGIHSLRAFNPEPALPVEGRDELAELADAFNTMSAARQQLRQQEVALAQEKDQLIRALSHDIRTPLTTIMAYTDYLSTQENLSSQERNAALQLIGRKSRQIRELTDLLLEESKRQPEYFSDAHLLMIQLAAEFEEDLADRFSVTTDLSGCGAFSATLDVQELRRIFDNLSSNAAKYADAAKPVVLKIMHRDNHLEIRQHNTILQPRPETDSCRIGLHSIRRIAQRYGGQVTTQEESGQFSICVVLSDLTGNL